jgi:phosphate transport system substrate-binding protein
MKIRFCGVLSLLLVCFHGTAIAQTNEPERLRVHGSNLLGEHLVPAMVDAWLRDIGYTQIRHRDLGPARTEISSIRDGEALVVEIDKHGTASGLRDITDGNAEISLSARQPTSREVEKAWNLGDLKSPSQEWVVGLDGLVLLVAPGNPISELNMTQLRGLASGRIRDWKQLGAAAGPIALHTLGPESGTQELLAQLALDGDKGLAPSVRHGSYADIVAAVAASPGAIGVVSLRAPRGKLKALAIRSGELAFAPDQLSVQSEDYPLVRRIYFHTGQSITALGRGFAEYAISPAGQSVVARSQFFSLALKPIKPQAVAAAPMEYRKFVDKAERLPMTLRFSSGLDLFDSRSRQDIERLASFLQRPENAKRRILLMGFANPEPLTPYQSLSLSQERADFVSSEMLALSLKVVAVRGFGGRMNLLDARQPAARYRNDRVEVWLR